MHGMKPDTQDQPMLVPQEEREILDQIRNDHELIERLRITPEELETLSKCAMFGTLTCKQDMLFILRQIREAGGGSAIGQTSLFPQPAPPEDQEEDPIPRTAAACWFVSPAWPCPSRARLRVVFVAACPSGSRFFSGRSS